MKLFKVDTVNWTVKEVDGEPWPGKDSDGDTCFTNTHFDDAQEAWDKLKAEVEAHVCFSGRLVGDAKKRLAEAEQDAARSTQAFLTVKSQLDSRNK